jgi:hypothetical protein
MMALGYRAQAERRSKDVFFVKKKQKTFVNRARRWFHCATPSA